MWYLGFIVGVWFLTRQDIYLLMAFIVFIILFLNTSLICFTLLLNLSNLISWKILVWTWSCRVCIWKGVGLIINKGKVEGCKYLKARDWWNFVRQYYKNIKTSIGSCILLSLQLFSLSITSTFKATWMNLSKSLGLLYKISQIIEGMTKP